MITDSGKKEAASRYQIVIDTLYYLFDEENVSEWSVFLKQYLQKKRQEQEKYSLLKL